MNSTDQLKRVLAYIKHTFIGKDEIVDLLGISLVAKENLFLLGPPGTAKSAIVRLLSQCLENGRSFEYLLTRFTEPSEIFGPFDIRRLKDGELVTNTEGMLPEASFVFLDEIFNANSAILNSLLMALNERIFRRGKETRPIPALMFVGASNMLPEDEALAALLDRFLLRVRCEYVDPDQLQAVLLAGWRLESESPGDRPVVDATSIIELQQACRQVDLAPVRKEYIDIVHSLRSTGIRVSDRRAVKLQNIIAASALISGRMTAILSDLWVLKYIWDTEEQIEILSGIIDAITGKDLAGEAHPQALVSRSPDPEEIMKEVAFLSTKWSADGLSFEERNVIKDKLRFVQNRCSWIKDMEKKSHIQNEIEVLWQHILQTP